MEGSSLAVTLFWNSCLVRLPVKLTILIAYMCPIGMYILYMYLLACSYICSCSVVYKSTYIHPFLGRSSSGDGFEHMYKIYSQEASLRQRIVETLQTMAVSPAGVNRDEMMLHLSCWIHHPYCGPESALTLESMLVDCGLRKVT